MYFLVMLELPQVHTAASWKISLFSSPPLALHLSSSLFFSTLAAKERGEVGHRGSQKRTPLLGSAHGSSVWYTEGGKVCFRVSSSLEEFLKMH